MWTLNLRIQVQVPLAQHEKVTPSEIKWISDEAGRLTKEHVICIGLQNNQEFSYMLSGTQLYEFGFHFWLDENPGSLFQWGSDRHRPTNQPIYLQLTIPRMCLWEMDALSLPSLR